MFKLQKPPILCLAHTDLEIEIEALANQYYFPYSDHLPVYHQSQPVNKI